VAFSPHGRELASAGIDGIDGIVHLWNAQSATTILQLKVGVAMTALDAIMLMVARWRRGEDDELLSPLVMPALVLGGAFATLLRAAAEESGGGDDPRRELAQVVEQMRSTAEILESMIPPEHLVH
jgi:hypothetical protein